MLTGTHADLGDELAMVGVLYQDDPDDARAFLARYGATDYDQSSIEGGRLAIDFGVTWAARELFRRRRRIVRAKQFGPLNVALMNERLAAAGFTDENQLPAIAVRRGPRAAGILAILWLFRRRDRCRPGRALAGELRCPDCQGLSVADSQTASAREIRRQVNELVAARATDDARAHFVGRYGESILLAPTSPVASLLPFAVLALGVAALATWLVRRRSPPVAPVSLETTTRRRLQVEVEALDA